MTRAGRAYAFGFVAVAGAVVMGLELLGARVLGTVYGSSLFVWGALLSTALAGLAVGYGLGGLVADRCPRQELLYVLAMLAGLAILAVPAMQGMLQPCFWRLGPRLGALACAAAMFVAPLVLLGAAGPFVIRLAARGTGATGRTAGTVFALSTIGSVAGTLATTFWLVPVLGTRAGLAALGGAMLLAAAGGLVARFGLRAAPAAAACLLVWPVAAAKPPAGEGVLFRTESPYGRLAVIEHAPPDQTPYRMLFVNGITQTGMPLDIGRRDRASLLRTDSYYLELLPYFYDDPDCPRRALLIGLAGGLFARVMALYPVDLTAVEIDVKVVQAAKAYFDCPGRIFYPDGRELRVDLDRFPRRRQGAHAAPPAPQHDPSRHLPGKTRIVIQDGRRFLAASPRRYDFIVLDAYSGDTIPFHLITREMFRLVRRHLTDEGILAVNYIGGPPGDEVTDCLARTLINVFGQYNVTAYRSTDDPEAVQVIYFFAFRGPAREPALPPDRWATGPGGRVDRTAYELWSRRLTLEPRRGRVITDDRNSIDAARVRTSLIWRAQALRMFGELNLHRF